MNSRNTRTIKNLVLVIILAMMIVLTVLFIRLNNNLGFKDTSATGNISDTKYSDTLTDFKHYGEIAGFDHYVGTHGQPFKAGGFGAITDVSFSAENIPTETMLKLCVLSEKRDTGDSAQLICESRLINGGTSGKLEWTQRLPFGLLVEPGKNYFCNVELLSLRQGEIDQQAYGASRVACNIEFKSTDNVDTYAIVVEGALLSKVGIGPNLLPNVNFLAQEDLKVLAVSTAVSTLDTSGLEQSFSDICLETASQKACLPSFNYSAQGQGRSGQNFKALENFTISSGNTFKFSCTTQSGKFGSCDVYAFIQVDPGSVAQLSDGSLDRRSLYSVAQADAKGYCEQQVYYYKNEKEFARYETDNKLIGRCSALLSGSSY